MAKEFALTDADRYCMLSGLSHDPLQRDMFTPVQCGATLCIPEADHMDSPDKLVQWLQREEITVAHLTPAMIQLLGQSRCEQTNELRYAFVGGDVLTVHDIETLEAVAPSVTCVNLYGATETQRAVRLLCGDDCCKGWEAEAPAGSRHAGHAVAYNERESTPGGHWGAGADLREKPPPGQRVHWG